MSSKKTINQHREAVIKTLSELNAYSKTMRDDIVEVKEILKDQNGRVRKNEKSISKIFGMGSVIMGVFSALITWLFNK
tara:strand:- start:3881 stop:4114 length:234 start_codon:yes stop_codon:yes gene_type:complete